MQVKKVAFLNNNNELVGEIPNDVGGVLVNLNHSGEKTEISFTFTLDKGLYAKPLAIMTEIGKKFVEWQRNEPKNILFEDGNSIKIDNGFSLTCYMFRNFLFEVKMEDNNEGNEAKAILLVKKYVYSEDAKWKKLNEEVGLMEKVLSQSGDYKRTAIPDSVKLFVFMRDEGKCARCGSVHNLHFDHIIPVAKGGGNSHENIQILCGPCNLKKSDKITF